MNERDTNQEKKLTIDHKILAKNTLYSYLNTYGAFFLSIISSFFIARTISQSEWGFLILALSYVNIFLLFLTFLPPSLGLSMNYYITKFRIENENSFLKSFLIKAMIIRILFTVIIFLIGILVFFFFTNFFIINLKENLSLFLVLAPLIIINGINKILYDIHRSFNNFKLVFILIVLNNAIYIIGLILFKFYIKSVKIEYIAFLLIISNLFPFIISSFYFFIILKFKLKTVKSQEEVTYRDTFKMLYKYGTPLSFNTYINSIHKEFRVQTIGFLESPDIVLGFNIGVHYSNVLSETVNSISSPMGLTFTKLYAKEEYYQIKRIYHLLFHYILFITLLLTGCLFFFTDFFLIVVYGSSYLRFSLICKISLIAIIFNIQNAFFYTQLRAFNKVNFAFYFTLLSTLIKIPLFIIGLVYFGIIGALIGIVFGNLLNFLILLILNSRLFSIKPQISKFVFQYATFFISLFITFGLRELFLFEFNIFFFRSLGLDYFQYFEIFSLLTFISIYLVLTITFKVISSSDIENIEAFFYKESKMNKIIRKILNGFKRITRK